MTLKEHLGLHHWWSAIPVLRQQQALVVLIVAQLLHATRLLIAASQGCDPFAVSFPLLVAYAPRLLHQRQHPVVWAKVHGHDCGLFRPSTRFQVQVPEPPLDQYVFPPADLPRSRLARYREYPPRPHRHPSSRKQAPPVVVAAVAAKQLPLFSSSVLRRLKGGTQMNESEAMPLARAVFPRHPCCSVACFAPYKNSNHTFHHELTSFL